MNAEPRRPNEEPYVKKLLVRFREGRGRQLPRLLDKNKAWIFSLLLFVSSSFSNVQNDLELQANIGWQSLFTAGTVMSLKYSAISYEFGYISNSKYEHIFSVHYPFRFENEDVMRIGIGVDFYIDSKDTANNWHMKEVLFPIQICYMKSILESENQFINFKFRFNMGAEHTVPYIQDNLIGIHIGYTYIFKASKIF
jgi:hypothetical protein